MKQRTSGLRRQESILNARYSYAALQQAMRRLIGDDSPRAIAAFFAPRATLHNVRDWRRAKSGVPAWALEHARQQARYWLEQASRDLASLDTAKPGSGRDQNIVANIWAKEKARQSGRA